MGVKMDRDELINLMTDTFDLALEAYKQGNKDKAIKIINDFMQKMKDTDYGRA